MFDYFLKHGPYMHLVFGHLTYETEPLPAGKDFLYERSQNEPFQNGIIESNQLINIIFSYN